MNGVLINKIKTDAEINAINNNASVSLVPIKTIILSMPMLPYMPMSPIEGVDLDVNR